MKNTRAIFFPDMDYKGIGAGRNQLPMINDELSMINYWRHWWGSEIFWAFDGVGFGVKC
ncbi:MAG: hypothetical protein K2N48_08205 [Muribaculaceae bacterium]|nr:hypothetical protein [Muribaculaceae bacterium]